MSDAKHSPAPWTYSAMTTSRYTDYAITSSNDVTVAETSGWIGGDEILANARLIAAAPEMLAALRVLIGANGRKQGQDGYCLWWTDEQTGEQAEKQAREAIVKAIGEADHA